MCLKYVPEKAKRLRASVLLPDAAGILSRTRGPSWLQTAYYPFCTRSFPLFILEDPSTARCMVRRRYSGRVPRGLP